MHALYALSFLLLHFHNAVDCRPYPPTRHTRSWFTSSMFRIEGQPADLLFGTNGTCLQSGNSTSIQALLNGPGSSAVLCPTSTFLLYDPVNFTAPNQMITTLGAPTDSTRANLVISANFTTAVSGGCDECSGAVLSHVQIDGGRQALGRPPNGGDGLIEMGGQTTGQVIEYVHAHDPRGFSCMHIFEGPNISCRNATVMNNDIGPCGVSAETDFPFPSQNGTGRSYSAGVPGTISSSLTSGKWSDGISLACPYSTVANNTITDASDGAIVIFGAFGSQVIDNYIIAANQTLLGGINLVDDTPSKNYTDVLVANNTIEARGGLIKVAIGCGPAVWGDDLTTRNFGATIQDNTLAGRYLGYGVLLSGVQNFTVQGNIAAPGAVFSAGQTESCHGLEVEPAAIVMNPATVESSIVQSGAFGPAQFAICVETVKFVDEEEGNVTTSATPLMSSTAPLSSSTSRASSLSSASVASLASSSAPAVITGVLSSILQPTPLLSTQTIFVTVPAPSSSAPLAQSPLSLSTQTAFVTAGIPAASVEVSPVQSSISLSTQTVFVMATVPAPLYPTFSSPQPVSLSTKTVVVTAVVPGTPLPTTSAFISSQPQVSLSTQSVFATVVASNSAPSATTLSSPSLNDTIGFPLGGGSDAATSSNEPLSFPMGDLVLSSNGTGSVGGNGKKPCPHPSHHHTNANAKRWINHIFQDQDVAT